MQLSQPTYAGTFHCIGSHCEDTCCGEWDIPVDKITYQKYLQFPAKKLGSLVAHFVSEHDGKTSDRLYANIRRKQDGRCPFFGTDQLCKIQKEYGTELLSSTCSIYPRSLAAVDGFLEGSLSLSCPEAARIVLLHENSTQKTANIFAGEFRTDNVFGVQQQSGLGGMLLPIRGLVIQLIQDRSRPIWQRLLTIASLCHRFNEIDECDLPAVTELLAQYGHAVGQGPFSELENLESRIETRLEMTIALSNQRCQDRDCGLRFRHTFWNFIEGIASSSGFEDAERDMQRFKQASSNHLEPYLNAHPYILENYLLNYVYQHLFPFGRAGSDRFVKHTIFEEAVLLVTQFSWLTTLLIGIAGRYTHTFTHTELITTVQAFTRAIEHTPLVLDDALAFVKKRELDDLAGLAKLLRT